MVTVFTPQILSNTTGGGSLSPPSREQVWQTAVPDQSHLDLFGDSVIHRGSEETCSQRFLQTTGLHTKATEEDPPQLELKNMEHAFNTP